MKEKQQKVVVVVGPTASGKTGLAIELAQKYDGEVISADSRQVYRRLDIGTEKTSEEEMRGIPHHLIDIADPKDTYTAARFVEDARRVIEDITARKKLSIIAGGTLFYVDALLGKQPIVPVEPNHELRTELEQKDTKELFALLEQRDPVRSHSIDHNNRRRLIRALEIVHTLARVPKAARTSVYDALVIGIAIDDEKLRERINTRLKETLKKGLVEETENLLESELTRERLNEIGLEYRVVIRHLGGELTYDEMVTELQNKIWQYAKRQMTWLKKDEKIKWSRRSEMENIENAVEKFLNI